MYINLTLISQKNINQVQMNNRVELEVVIKVALQLNWNSELDTHTHYRVFTERP